MLSAVQKKKGGGGETLGPISIRIGTPIMCPHRKKNKKHTAHLLRCAWSTSKPMTHSKMPEDPTTASFDSVKKACTAYLPGRQGPSSNRTWVRRNGDDTKRKKNRFFESGKEGSQSYQERTIRGLARATRTAEAHWLFFCFFLPTEGGGLKSLYIIHASAN